MRNTWRFAGLSLLGVAATLGTALAAASPASASTSGTTSAVGGSPPAFSSDQCVSNSVSEACFEPSGDKVWVYDSLADGAAADADWVNYLRDSAGNWYSYRDGTCANHLGAGHWGYCNYDFYEDSSFNAQLGYGSGIRVYLGDDRSTYAWVRNNN